MLFAFHSAWASVVIAKQPTWTRLRTTHGATTTSAAASRVAARGSARPRWRHARYATSTSGSTASREFPRMATPAVAPAAAASAMPSGSSGEQHEEEQRGGSELVEDLAVDVNVVPDQVRVQRCEQRCQEARKRIDELPSDPEHGHRRAGGDRDLRGPDHEPMAAEDPVERDQKPAVQRLGVGGRLTRCEAVGPGRYEGAGEDIALLDERLEDRPAFDRQHHEARQDRGSDDGDR